MASSTHLRLAVACLLPFLAAACATRSPADPPPGAVVEQAPRLLLLGEVHDNAAGHEQRLGLLRQYAAGGADMVIAMEQFDRQRQPDLDAAMARCADAPCVIEAASSDKAGWTWAYYAPVIQLALDHDIPLLAANLSRDDAASVVKDGFQALPEGLRAAYLDKPLPEALLAAQVEAVRDGHCGMLPESMLEPMARAQVARDVVMADVMIRALAHHRYVFLLAGNGHVNRDIGVPHWLLAGDRGEQVSAIGYLEQGNESARSHFDSSHMVAPAERDDPCAGFARGRGSDR